MSLESASLRHGSDIGMARIPRGTATVRGGGTGLHSAIGLQVQRIVLPRILSRYVLAGSLLPITLWADLRFEEVAEDAGIAFRHAASKTAEKYLVEAMGAGVATLDFDGDGLLDVYFVNGADLTSLERGAPDAKSDRRYWNRLYRNTGDWRFEDVTERADVAGSGYGMGVAVADYDADGDPDLFVSNFGPDALFRNEGDGSFREISDDAGIEGPGWSSGAAFLDFDGDGWLDLFVSRYLEWSFEESRPCGESLPERTSYCHPRVFAPARHTLYRNLGDGRFEDVSTATGIAAHPGKGLGVAVNDFDDDGWVDIFVANDSYPQQLFRNLAGTRFEELAVKTGSAYDAEGREYAGMGVVWDDYDRDLRPDVLVNALGRQGYWLYRNQGTRFEPVSDASGLTALSELRSGWGMGLVDFDNDGWRDLIVGQGHVMDDIGLSDEALAHKEPLMLARNLFGRFYDVSRQAGPVFQRPVPARGIAFGDLDGDGRVDAAVNVNDGPALVLRNVSNGGRGLTVRLVGTGRNRDAVGAIVHVKNGEGVEQRAFRGSAGSYLSANSPDIHFGLGESGLCEWVTVRWPDGSTQTVTAPDDPLVIVRQAVSPESQTN